MTATTTYTCDGCGTTAEERAGHYPLNWANPTFPGYGTKHFCTGCSPRVAIYGERLSYPCPEVEAACAPLREGLEQSERLLEESRKSNESNRHRAEAMIRRAEAAEEEARACSQIIQDLHEELKEARADAGFSEHEHRTLVLELLNMLGKKSQRRNKKRLREIRLAVASVVEGAEGGEPDFLDEIMAERGLGGDS